ncbi:MAG: tRNA (N(6)-L-threonylcarbamoyladenosine(37)-C(2))-methylthiotransferase MtaB [Bacilli bacterium]|jgi:threonylcarbamoyladenosine tRNA methylthiotransferase MtaB
MVFKIFSLGCKVNSYECAALASLLQAEGYQEDDSLTPDVVIINTCSVTSTADQKSRQHIRKFQREYPNSIIVVMGCYAQGNKDYILENIKPTILVGASHRHEIPELIREHQKTNQQIVRLDKDTRNLVYEEFGITSYYENTRAYLKIEDGCNNFCTYCIIPYRRGQLRSRKPEHVISEAEYLVKQGYQEIILSGIHVGGYGQDLKDMTFSKLVEKLLNIPKLSSLRISSIEEVEIDDRLIQLLKDNSNLAKHLHIPLQSGSKTVLKRMARRYSTEDFLAKIKRIKQEIPRIAITTDVIAGFPGETEEEFMETYNFIKECGFHLLHVFPFSARSGTPAARMDKQVAPELKKERVNKLLALSKELWENYTSQFIGQNVTILVEEYNNGFNLGHTTNYMEVKVPSYEGKIGEHITVKLTKDMIISK